MVKFERDPKSGVWVVVDAVDLPTQERADKQGGISVTDRTVAAGGRAAGKGAVANAESMIDMLALRGDLGPRDRDEFKFRRMAAEWMREAFYKAGLSPHLTGRYDVRVSGGEREMTKTEVAGWHAYLSIWKAVADAELLERVVCFDEPPNAVELPRLLSALDALAEWRGYTAKTQARMVATAVARQPKH